MRTRGPDRPEVARFRQFCADRVDLYRTAVITAGLVADNTDCCRSILAVVREIVRGLVTDAVGEVVSTILRYPPPAAPAATGGICRTTASTGSKVRQWLGRLRRAFADAGRMSAIASGHPKTVIEPGKDSVHAAAPEAKEPERPADPSGLCDGPGPHRASRTL